MINTISASGTIKFACCKNSCMTEIAEATLVITYSGKEKVGSMLLTKDVNTSSNELNKADNTTPPNQYAD